MPRRGSLVCGSLFFLIGFPQLRAPGDPPDPETAIRQMVKANAEKDLPTLSRLMAHDADIVSYSIGGRKYIGWPEFEREMREEFVNTQKIEIPITEIKVWTKGDLAWFTMELDYTRFVGEGSAVKRTVLPLRETGVLERRAGRWQLLSWHESFRSAQLGGSSYLDVDGPGIAKARQQCRGRHAGCERRMGYPRSGGRKTLQGDTGQEWERPLHATRRTVYHHQN